jgi:hypothetical protein
MTIVMTNRRTWKETVPSPSDPPQIWQEQWSKPSHWRGKLALHNRARNTISRIHDHSLSCFTSITFSKHAVILERQRQPTPPQTMFFTLKMETEEFPHLNDFLAGSGLNRSLIYVVLRYISPISFRLALSEACTQTGKHRCHCPSHFITRLCSCYSANTRRQSNSLPVLHGLAHVT